MLKPSVGIITFLDSRTEMREKRSHIVEDETGKLVRALEDAVDLVTCEPVTCKQEAVAAARRMVAEGVDLVLFHVPSWAGPELVVTAAQQVAVPLLVLGNERYDSSSLVALLAACGSFDQLGIGYTRAIGDPGDPSVKDKILRAARAAFSISKLKGSTYGHIGGRCFGMYTATADPSEVQSRFAVDIEHIDQSEVIRIAETIPAKQMHKYLDWLRRNLRGLLYDGNVLTEEKLNRQIRSYLAVKEIVQERRLDFIGLKCQPELSDHYVVQCLTAALMNDPYDADGAKEPIVCACETDVNGALTMQILKLLSGGKPTSLVDVRGIDREKRLMVLANCGSMPTYFARYSFEPEDNLKAVTLMPHVFGKAGGGTTQFVCGDSKATVARLMTKTGKYWMALAEGDLVERPGPLDGIIPPFPYAFVRVNLDADRFLADYGSNHIHIVAADVKNDLVEFCRLLGLECVVYC
ncbi:MAG: L-fucose/L-arabinose isomerase family protein [Armatimonadetes bacterium]|nr:L-fucose/L-arabinose isomerase family protein [Armatimonadota bacterium]